MPLINQNHPIIQLTARSKEFIDNIVSYNNCLSFISEGTTNVDHRVARTTFRIQGSVHYRMGPLMPDDSMRPKFAQIYTIDGTQEQMDARQDYISDLDPDVLRTAQRALSRINLYIESFKSCYDRIKEDEDNNPAEALSVRIQQLDPKRRNRGTHNRPTSTEVARVIVTPNDVTKGRIRRDIRIEARGGGLILISNWHPLYMALRYPLLFPFGEQSWHDGIPIAGYQLQSDHLLHAYRRHRGVSAFTDPFDPEPEQDIDMDPEHAEPVNNDGDVQLARGRGGSTRLTRRIFYLK